MSTLRTPPDSCIGGLIQHSDKRKCFVRIAELLAEVDETAYAALGFSADEVDEITGMFDFDDADVVEIETGTVADRFWISIRGPLESQADALDRLQELTAEIPGVEVELGTTPVDG